MAAAAAAPAAFALAAPAARLGAEVLAPPSLWHWDAVAARSAAGSPHRDGACGPRRFAAAAAAAVAAAAAAPLLAGRSQRPRRPLAGKARGATVLAASKGGKSRPRWAPSGSGKNKLAESTQAAITAMDDGKTVEMAGEGRVYRVLYDAGIGLRDRPSIEPRHRTGEDLLKGEVFEVKTEVLEGGRKYLELIDGRGWAFDWSNIDGERVELVELAAQLYTVAFPSGVSGVAWCSDTTLQFCMVKEFLSGADVPTLRACGLSEGDILVMIDQDPVIGMPFGQVLERVWATGGRQPGSGTYYKVVTEGPYGMGIRETPDRNGPRTGQDLIRGSVFEVDEVIEAPGEPTYLRLADGRGWVFDMTPVDPSVRTVQRLDNLEAGATMTLWRGSTEELAQTLGISLRSNKDSSQMVTISVLQEGQPLQRVCVPAGSNLRSALVDNDFQVYQNVGSVFNCSANQLCGTCVLSVVEGNGNLTSRSVNEKRSMDGNPDNYRLCCNIDVYGDVAVRLRPPNVKYGPGTS